MQPKVKTYYLPVETVALHVSRIFYFSSYLPDGVTEVLRGDADSGPGHAEQRGGAVVELEHPVVDVDLVELEPARQIVHQMSHLAALFSSPLCINWV